jgi:DNA modification methylase
MSKQRNPSTSFVKQGPARTRVRPNDTNRIRSLDSDCDGSLEKNTFSGQIERVKIASLCPSPHNARTHSPLQIKQIQRSIEHFGFTNPVLIDEAGQILAGHGRVEAAKRLGWATVPIVRIAHLSVAQKRAYIIADNELAAKAGWDKDILAIELQGLVDLKFDLELTGFEGGEIDIILGDRSDTQHNEDIIPSPSAGEAVTRAGDLWQLGEHRLICADARDPSAYKRLMSGDKARFVITDPPYNVPIAGHASGLGSVRHQNFQMASGELSSEDFTIFLSSVFRLQIAYAVDGAIHEIFIDWRHMREMLEAGEGTFTELKNLCVWVKSNGGMGTFYRSRHELVFVWKSGRKPHVNNFELGQFGRSRTNVWEYAGVNSFGERRREELAMHPTCKPVDLVADAVKDCSKRNDLVLDAFGGSGTTLIACQKTGRRGRLIEINPTFCDVTVRRWQDYSGGVAIHAETGLSFAETQARLTLPTSPQESLHERRTRKRPIRTAKARQGR